MDVFLLMLNGLFFSVVVMLLVWILYLTIKKAAIVDIGWSSVTALLGFFYYFQYPSLSLRKLLLLAALFFWGGRLTLHLIQRLWMGQEDRRYDVLDKKFESYRIWKYLLFFQAQAVVATVLSLAFALVMASEAAFQMSDFVAAVIFLLSFLGELKADQTMTQFRSDPQNKDQVCKVGLWKYSRHPNYFFECLIWVSFALFAWPTPFGFLAWISPAIITYSILKVTGIPPTEEILLASKGEAYKEYQRTTSALIPWFPKGS